MITAFKNYLLSLNLSPISRKLYLSDIRRFLAFIGNDPSLDQLSQYKYYLDYLKNLASEDATPSMIKRTTASLNKFTTFLAESYGLSIPTQGTWSGHSSPSTLSIEQSDKYIKPFSKYLISEHLSLSTIKSYKSDVTRYLDWAHTTLASNKMDELLTGKNIEKYLNYLSESLSTLPSTIERKIKSIARFQAWFHNVHSKLLTTDIIEKPSQVAFTPKSVRQEPNQVIHPLRPKFHLPDQAIVSVKNLISRILDQNKFQLSRPLTIDYRSFATFAIMLIFITTLGFFGYRSFSKETKLIAAYPSTAITPNRNLSFQGRLENSSGTPITSATNFEFKLWNDLVAGTQLYTTGTCSITPDTDGVFSTQIGSTCGSAIDSSVFSENANIFLEVKVASDTLTPRQPISSVAYALNSETIQGFPISSTISAIRNTIVPMNQWGEIIVGEQNPRLTGVSGNFQISAPSLTFSTTSNGDIALSPNGTGKVNLNGGTTTTNFFNVSNPSLTTGSLITGTVANNNTGLKLLDLLSGSSPTSKFSVTDAGNTTLAGDLTITGDDLFMNTNTSGMLLIADGTNFNPTAVSGDITINGSGVTAIGADKITEAMLKSVNGPTDEMCLTYESTVGDFEWQTCGSTSEWTRVAGNISPAIANDTISATTSAAVALTLTQTGAFNALLVEDQASDTTPFIIDQSGNVAIGGVINSIDGVAHTIDDVSGNLTLTSNSGLINTPGDLKITGDDLFMNTNTSGMLLIADGTNFNPTAVSGDITINGSGVTAIGADKITEAMLKSVNGPTDEMCLTYESTVGDFEWQTCGSSGTWTLAGDSGASQTITSGDTASIVGGTNGIDTVASATDTLTLNLDTTEINNATFGSGSGFTWTFDGSGGTDTTLAFGDNLITATTASLSLVGSATISGVATIGNGTTNAIQTPFGPLSLRYKSGLNTWATAMTIQDSTGFVGIGTTAPSSNTEILGNVVGAELTLGNSDTVVDAADILGAISFKSYDISTNGTKDKAYIRGVAESTFTSSDHRAKLEFGTSSATNDPSTTMTLDSAGNLTMSGDLAVNGATSADITSTTTTATIFDSTVTTLSLGSAATTLNVAAGGALARAINIGTGTGVDTINIGTGATGADVITLGNTGAATSYLFNTGATTTTPLTFDFDTVTTSSAIDLSVDGLTTGTGLLIDNNVASSLTTGTLLQAQSVATSLTSAADAYLGYFNWSPGSSTTATGDLFRINIGSNGTATNLFNITDNSSSLFSVSESLFTSNLTSNFTAAGGVNMSYDLNFTNGTSSTITSDAPLTIAAGETFNSSNLTLKTYNTGDLVIDASGGITLSQAQAWDLANSSTTSLNFESGLLDLDTANSRVGIGNSAPTATLDVTGTASISGALTIGNTGVIRSAYDDLVLQYKSGLNTWATALSIQDGTGYILGNRFVSNTSTSQYLDLSNTGTALAISGDILNTDAAAFTISSTSDNNIVIDAGAGTVQIGAAGAGKLDAATIDPPYTINGTKFATYMASMTGVKEETTGNIYASEFISGQGYRATLDLATSIQGSDIWLFSKTTNLKHNLDKMVVLLSSAGNTKTWYDIDASNGKLYLYSLSPTTISYRLTAPRYDAQNWLNTRDINASTGLVVNDNSDWSVSNTIANIINAGKAQIATVFGNVETNLISPLDTSKGITISAPVAIKPTTTSEPALNVDGEILAATISARTAILKDVQAENIIAKNITADSISANHIEGLDARIASLSGKISDQDLTSITDRIKSRLDILTGNLPNASDLPTPQEATNSATLNNTTPSLLESSIASGSAILSSLSADFATINGYLAVIGQATMTDLDVTNVLYTSKIDSKTGTISLANNTLIIDSTGSININGDLFVSGKVLADSATLNSLELGTPSNAISSSMLGQLLSIYNESGVAVATIDASGSANLSKITTEMITISGSKDASSSALLTSSINSTATAGVSSLISPDTELTISSPYVTKDTLAYLTPTANTQNKVLFVKSKNTCDASTSTTCIPSFTVGIDSPASSDISFNWWIIQVK